MYDETYVPSAFTSVAESEATPKPKCFLCDKVLTNARMKPNYLKEHLKSVYPKNMFEKARTLPKTWICPRNSGAE
jgi:hypothetical protein